MCDLLGMSYKEMTDINKHGIIRKFMERKGAQNPNGWGLGLYLEDDKTIVYKEAKRGDRSILVNSLFEKKLMSHTYISHLRSNAEGGNSYDNTQPFVLKTDGKEYIFAHDGYVYKDLSDKQKKEFEEYMKGIPGLFQKVKGDSGSEVISFLLLEHLKDMKKWDKDELWGLYVNFLKLNDYAKMNIIISDGSKFIVYADKFREGRIYTSDIFGRFVCMTGGKKPGKNWMKMSNGGILIFEKGVPCCHLMDVRFEKASVDKIKRMKPDINKTIFFMFSGVKE